MKPTEPEGSYIVNQAAKLLAEKLYLLHSTQFLTRAEAAKYLGFAERSFDRYVGESLLPAPVVIGNTKRWGREELHDWVRAGAPNQLAWESMKHLGPPKHPTPRGRRT